LLSSVAAAVCTGLILWPAAASGGHASSSDAVPPLAGDLDPSFGNEGTVTRDPGYLGAIAVQLDGKIIVEGSEAFNSGFLLARYLPNGLPDPSFGDGGYVETQSGLPTAGLISGAVALQPDGKIVVAGESSAGFSCQPNEGVCSGFALARFNPNGSLDTSFGTDGVTTTAFPNVFPGGPPALSSSSADALAILPDGEIVAGGWALSQVCCSDPPAGSFALAEYTPAGSLDPAFGDHGIVQTSFPAAGAGSPSAAALSSLAVQADGDIVASGSNVEGAHGDHVYDTAIARYKPNGSLDPTFGTGGKMQTPEKLQYEGGPSALQNGKIVVIGFRSNDDGYAQFPVIARFGAGGHIDPTFGNHGYEAIRSLKHEAAEAVVTQPDGKILVVTNSAIVRLLPNGGFDPSFGRRGTVTLAGAINLACPTPQIDECGAGTGLAVQADGNVLVGGTVVSEDQSSDTLTLARLIGGNNCVVPRLRGKTPLKARAKLKASYCSTGHISRLFSNKIARGHLITTAPLPGDRRPAGTKIDLLVSRGKPAHHS
jgi:uncharacterized delta-60 repeat protein